MSYEGQGRLRKWNGSGLHLGRRRSQVHRIKVAPRLIVATVVGFATFGVIALPVHVASAATQTVTNCNHSGAGPLRQALNGAASKSKITSPYLRPAS